MPPELTRSQVDGHAEALLHDARDRTADLSAACHYRVLKALADKIDDHLDTLMDPDGPDGTDATGLMAEDRR